MKKSMPFEQFGRTHTQPVNLQDLEARFEDGATIGPAELSANGLATRKGIPVKVLGQGDLTKKLTISAHGFSKSAREKIESAGGSVTVLD
jgi:large subunit ribosomal protein L15